MTTDDELVRTLLPHWHATRAWVEALLCRVFRYSDAKEILSRRPRIEETIPGSTWSFRVHGVGIDVSRGINVGGIDFDFDQPDPDPWRLRCFAERQLNAGNLPVDVYQRLLDDEVRFRLAAERVLSTPSG
jgi:hypothetical protein